RQYQAYVDAGKPPPATQTFDLHSTTEEPLRTLPDDVPVRDRAAGKIGPAGDPLWDRLTYDFERGRLILHGALNEEQAEKLTSLSSDRAFNKLLTSMANKSRWPGMICSV